MEINAFSEIIKAAAVSPLGIIALCCLLFAFLALKFFQNANQWLRLFVFLLLFISFIGSFLLSTYGVEPILANQNLIASSNNNSEPPIITDPESTETTETKSAPSQPAPQTETRRVDAGTHWTGWIEVGDGVGSPCPSGSYRGDEVGQSYRSVGFPPRVQTKHNFQCWRDEQVTIQ